MTVTADVFVSVVAPLRNDATLLAGFVDELMDVLRARYANYEVVLVDDASTDATAAAAHDALARHECIRYLRLSRHFGEEVAIAAGLDAVIGDFVVVMLPNTDPPSLIPTFVDRARASGGVVFGIRTTRAGDSVAVRAGAAIWYWAVRHLLGLDLPKDALPFRVLSRQAVNAMTQLRDHYRDLRLQSAHVGYTPIGIPYTPITRNPVRPSRSFGDRFGVAVKTVVATSPHPLRAVTMLALAGGFLNLLYVAYIFAVYFFKQHVAEGWTTLSLQSAGMFFLVFMVLTVMSEYIGHIMLESRERPLYHIADDRGSPVSLAGPDRRNVVLESRAR